MEDQNIADSFIEELTEITAELGICYDINAIYVNQKDKKIIVEFNYSEDNNDNTVIFTQVIEEANTSLLDEELDNEHNVSLDKDDYNDFKFTNW